MQSETSVVVQSGEIVPAARGDAVAELVRLTLDGKSAGTANAMRWFLSTLRKWTEAEGVPTANGGIDLLLDAKTANLTVHRLKTWALTAKGKRLRPQTVNLLVTMSRLLLKVARLANMAEHTIDVEQVRVSSRKKPGPGIAELRKIAAWLDAREDAGYPAARDRAMFGLMFVHGLRAAEVLGLKWGAVSAGEVSLRRKGRLESEPLALHPVVDEMMALLRREALAGWSGKAGRPAGEDDWCFVADRRGKAGRWGGSRMSMNDLYRLMDWWCEQAGVSVKVRPHGIRHTSITEVITARGTDVARCHAGHADTKTTAVYDDAEGRRRVEGADAALGTLRG